MERRQTDDGSARAGWRGSPTRPARRCKVVPLGEYGNIYVDMMPHIYIVEKG